LKGEVNGKNMNDVFAWLKAHEGESGKINPIKWCGLCVIPRAPVGYRYFSISDFSSSGLTPDPNRPTTLPSLSTKNLVKFLRTVSSEELKSEIEKYL
jgi:hypothetical protein